MEVQSVQHYLDFIDNLQKNMFMLYQSKVLLLTSRSFHLSLFTVGIVTTKNTNCSPVFSGNSN